MRYLLIFLLAVGCATVNQPLNTSTLYKKDIKFWVNGIKFKGVGVASSANSYEIYIEYPQGKIDLLSIKTCHRQEEREHEGTKATFIYRPALIEKDCPIDLGIFHQKGRHGWGYILFDSPEYKLASNLECNGETLKTKGVSICQGLIGTLQRISFDKPVRHASSARCPVEVTGNSFKYIVQKDLCRHAFIDSDGNLHHHTAYGYETFIIGG